MSEILNSIKDGFLWLWAFDEVRFTIDALVKIGLAALLSGIIGFEREHSHRPAGFRTHILVSVGSALVMLTSVYIAKDQGMVNDVTRMSGQVISGIGILGAGGSTSVLAVNVEYAYTHIAGIAVATSTNCMVARRASSRIDADGRVTVMRSPNWFGDR